MLDLTGHRVVDSHCHAFLPEREPARFGQCLTLSEHPIPERDVASTFLHRRVVRELSRVLGIKGPSGEVIDERNRRYRGDPAGYIRMLFDDAGIDTLLVDTGYPSDLDLEDFSRIVPCNIREIFRIETLSLELLRRDLPFDALIDEYIGRMDDAVGKGAVALKTVIAYRTGLEVKRRADGEVRKAYEAFTAKAKAGVDAREIIGLKADYVKKILDHFVFLAAESSARLDVPFQIHVGMGDVPGIDLRLSKPSLLHELVNDEAAGRARVVLTHGGYPHIEEAGFMVNTYPNVYLDMSQTNPFISIGLDEKLRNLLEMAPTTKIMHGSDGYNIPELSWIAALQAKQALERVLGDLIERNEVDEEGAQVIAAQFLSDNARRFYDL
jgi:predicted TIM-barrel fold metal-dependent hydrolase